MPKKVAILIDGENLWNALDKLGKLGIDLGEFKIRLANGKELAKLPIYYTSVIDTEIDERTLRFFDYLRRQGYDIRYQPISGGKEPKSEIDPWISDGIYRCAVDKNVSIIKLLSGDHHFVPAVNFAKERGKKVIVVSTASSLSKKLKRVSNEYVDLKDIIIGIPRSKIEQKREEALEKLNKGKEIILPTLKENP